MKIKLPTALIQCIDKHISEEKDFFQIKEKQKQLLNQKLINLWYVIYSKQVEDNYKTLKFYTNIRSDDFRSFKFKFKSKTYQYNQLLYYLNNWGLIDINHIYCSKKGCNSFSKSYRIKTEFLCETEMTEVEIDFCKIFKNTRNMDYWLNKYPEYSNLITDCYNTTIKLDDFVNWLYNNSGKKLKDKMINGFLAKRYLTSERIIMYTNKALKLHFKNLWFKVSNEGRFYSSITNLPSDCIEFLELYSKEIVELDVSNCQPLLLASIIKNLEYKKDAENGVFYDKMAAKIGKKREVLKNFSYKYLFFSNKILKSGIIYKAINECYPLLIEQINNIKKQNKLSLVLQKMESSIFIEQIGKLPYPKITIHDSVLVQIEDYNFFKKMIENEFQKLDLKVSFKNDLKNENTLIFNQQ